MSRPSGVGKSPKQTRITLEDPYHKTGRAKVHLDALRQEISAFVESNPIRVFPKDDVKHGRYRIRIKVNEIPPQIPLIAGDCFYCLRSALDQTVWALAKRKMGVGYPTHTQFPIFEHNTARNRQKFRQYTAGIPAAAMGVLKSFQPYHRANPSAHLLSTLNALCNIDKHRRIPVHSQELIVHFPDAPVSIARFFEFDAEQQMFSVPLEYKSQVNFEPKASFNVVFGDFSADPSNNIPCDLDRMINIYEFVTNTVIPKFARFFA
jgi:hypothetical protein